MKFVSNFLIVIQIGLSYKKLAHEIKLKSRQGLQIQFENFFDTMSINEIRENVWLCCTIRVMRLSVQQ
jgi:hypothetical protein